MARRRVRTGSRDAVDVEVSTAREWVRIGRALVELDVIDNAFEQGLLSYSKVRALTRIATPETQVELCALAQRVPAARLAHALAAWLARHETPDETDARHQRARTFSWRWRSRWDARRIVPARAVRRREIVNSGRCAASSRADCRGCDDASADASPRGFRRVAVDRAAASGRAHRPGPRRRCCGRRPRSWFTYAVMGARWTTAAPITGSVVERIAPQAFLRALIHDAEGRPINASGRQRHPTTRQRRVVKARDRACVDCGATELLQYDHDPDFEVSHRTLVDELCLRCWACHRSRHRAAVVLTVIPDRRDDAVTRHRRPSAG